MTKKTVALSIEEQIYDKYREFCERQGMVLSKQVERFMEKELVNKADKNE